MNKIALQSQTSWTKATSALIVSLFFYILISFDVTTTYQFIIIIALLTSTITFVKFITISISKNLENNQRPAYSQIISVAILLLIGTLTYGYRNGFFYGRKVVNATFLDDTSRIDLCLFEDGHYLITSGWILGSETFSGTYTKTENIITFNNYPVIDTDFIDKSIAIKGNKIYFRANTPDTSFYHFKINQQ